MKKNILNFLVLLISGILFAQDFEGAWKLTHLNGEPVTNREVIKISQNGYFALGSRDVKDNSFLGAAGGEFKIENGNLIELRDFDTYEASKIGIEKMYTINWKNESTLEIFDAKDHKVWQKVSNRNDELNGNWVITGRMRDGEMNKMIPGDRRTLKILGGGRFQWIAFNSATKTFYASGGGAYKAQNGKYEEQIEFFSKDVSRVGATLEFDYEVKDEDWYHSGKSSKGQPILEIWSPYADNFPVKFQ